MQQALQRGLRAGALAGLLLVGIFFVDYGPATHLSTIAHWFAVDGNAWSKLIGAILLVVLGAVFGGLYTALVRLWSPSLSHSVLVGLATGLSFWVLLVLCLATGVRHIQQSLYERLFWLMASLLYGLMLGCLYGAFQEREGTGGP
jgi:drug/metabolite transporter (DMT)-like permease